MQFEGIVFQNIAIIGPRRVKAVCVGGQFLSNSSSKTTGTEDFNACFGARRINGEAIGKCPAGIDGYFPGGNRSGFQNSGFRQIFTDFEDSGYLPLLKVSGY